MSEEKEAGSLTVEQDANVPSDSETLKAMLVAERIRNGSLQKQVDEQTERLKFSVPMILSFQPYIPQPPQPKEALWQQACANDKTTSEAWRETWLKAIEKNVQENDADNRMVDQHYGKHAFHPCIIAGSGPSLKRNVDVLAKETPPEIPIISCLHNFGYFVDKGVPCDYYVTLDAGGVTIPEMTQGGSEKDITKYLKASESKTLLAGLVTPSELVKQWKGKVLFFNATIPDDDFMGRMKEITKNKWVYSVGGNTLGACMYHAAYIFGCNPIALVGADFAFDYMHKFHSWDSPYDAQFAGLMPSIDVWGNRVWSWRSYQNFKVWFEFQAMGGQGGHFLQLVNCTEGGTLGAYPEGNIMQIKQLRLFDFLDGYTRWKRLGPWIEKSKPGEYTVMC